MIGFIIWSLFGVFIIGLGIKDNKNRYEDSL